MKTGTHEGQPVYDVVGVGFGPSNLSLAIALEEHRSNTPQTPLRSVFFERQPSFGWHRNMLLPGARMQISFLKDLAMFRNPQSPFTFTSYLHEAGRLAQFVNNQDFFPARQEFHDYLEWAQSRFTDRVAYGTEVLEIALAPGSAQGSRGTAEVLRVTVREVGAGGGTRTVEARNVVVATGLVPRMPVGVERDEHIWHSGEFLARFRDTDVAALRRVAVVGAGQSAAEIARYLYDRVPHAEVSAIIPSYGYSVADDSPFANRVFDPSAVDDYFHGTQASRDAFWRYHRNTNYSVVDDAVLKDLHQRIYADEVGKTPRLRFINLTRVEAVKRVDRELRIALNSALPGAPRDIGVDALICATGYEAMEPTGLLSGIDRHCLRDHEGRLRVERDYRLTTSTPLPCGIYLQGGTEHTHGLTSSLLSNLAIRSGEIADSIARGGDRR